MPSRYYLHFHNSTLRLGLSLFSVLALLAVTPCAIAIEGFSNRGPASQVLAPEQAEGSQLPKLAEVGLDEPLRFGPTREPSSDLLNGNGNAGLGIAFRFEDSLYRGGGMRHDLVPLYLYEDDHFYLQAYRAGFKLVPNHARRFDMFLTHRFEGFPYDIKPVELDGMATRSPGLDWGFSYKWKEPWGNYFVGYLHDVSGTSLGSEMQVGFSYDLRHHDLTLTPHMTFALRNANLNNYYYGVRPNEATATRPAYEAGTGLNTHLGLDARYRLTPHWYLIGGIYATRWSDEVRFSPIVETKLQTGGFVGIDYDFEPQKRPMDESSPLIIKVFQGRSTECNLMPIMGLSCTSMQTVDKTRVAAVELGKPFYENFNGLPIDFVGYVSFLRHDEQGLQDDFWQFNAYMKVYFYGFPWSNAVRTRVGFGAGISYAQQIPYVEGRDQAERGRNTSKLLNYLDPSIDVSVGDLLGIKSQKETYFGFGVSHRSGIFGTSQVLGNVDGGSNYIYTYLEWRI